MKIVNFENDPQLGQVVSKSDVFCKLTQDFPPAPTPENEAKLVPFLYNYVVGVFENPKFHGLAGHKWSRLCGFTFTSNINKENPVFQFVYVPKLRGNFTRNNAGLHGWYCWKYVAVDNRVVMSIDNMMSTYKFNINRFVFSDMFDKYVAEFVKNISLALNGNVQKIYDLLPNSTLKKNFDFYFKAISTSLNDIYKVKEVVTYDEYWERHKDDDEKAQYVTADPKAGHVKIAYNADKTYKLKNLDAQRQADKQSQDAADQNSSNDVQTPQQDA